MIAPGAKDRPTGASGKREQKADEKVKDESKDLASKNVSSKVHSSKQEDKETSEISKPKYEKEVTVKKEDTNDELGEDLFQTSKLKASKNSNRKDSLDNDKTAESNYKGRSAAAW